MSFEEHAVSFSLQVNVEDTLAEIRRLQTVLYRSLSLLQRLGLPEDVEKGIIFVRRMIAVLNELRLAILAVQAASGPIGWALALLGLAGAGFSYADMIESGMNTR